VTPATTDLPGRLKGCRGVLVDSNVLLDIATNDPNWGEWSARTLAEVAEHASLIINPIVYAEVSIGYSTIEALDAALPAALYRREALPWEAGFLAERCFVQYRRRGGPRHLHLPDFYKGAHAAVGRLALLTRDAAWYRTYFPGVEIIAPPTPAPARPRVFSRTSPRAR
jgi:predicted nucleic acid-binding protein